MRLYDWFVALAWTIAITLMLNACAPYCISVNKTTRGIAGTPGKDGVNGLTTLASSVYFAPSCSAGGVTFLFGLDLNRDGELQGEEVTSSAEVCNGLAGQDGEDAAPTAFTPTELVDPCGDAPEVYDEVLIRLSNGSLIASFSDSANGKNTRFALLEPGTYVTTDGSDCVFTVGPDGEVL
jgi:hypothetical protein